MVEGFDLVALGAVIPTLLETGHVGFTPATATYVATASLVGMGIGAAGVGPVTDRIGRRKVILACVALFSVFTFLIPLAPTVFWFGALRFVAGVGLGAVMPTALTFMAEHSGDGNTAKATTLTMTGYHVGAVLTSLLAVALVPNWQVLFYAGGIAGIVLLPVLWARLPESTSYLAAQSRPAREKSGSTTLFSGRFAGVTIGVWVASFMGLLLVYGLNTWLPQIMRAAGYEVADALVLLLVLNLGAVAGLVLAGWLADRRGARAVVLVWFLCSAVFLAALSIRMESQVLLNLAVFITGLFVFSAQVLVYAFVSTVYPASVRGTALGMAAGVGRLGAIVGPFITGGLVTFGLAYPWGFYVFAVVAVFAFAAMALVPSVDRARI